MSIRNTTRTKLLAGVGTTVLATMIAGGAYAAGVTIPDMTNATAAGHKTVEFVNDNSGLIEASVTDADGKLSIDGEQTGTSNSVTDNTIRADATANNFTGPFSNAIDLSLIQDDEDSDNLGLAALGVATNTGTVTSSVENNSLSAYLTGFESGSVANTDNTIRAQSTVNSGATTIAGTIPNSFASETEGSMTMEYPGGTPLHEAQGSIVASSVQMNSATDNAATADGNEIGLTLYAVDDNNNVDSSPALDRNTIDAAIAVNSATSKIDLQSGRAPGFEGSAVVSNLQGNTGSAAASNTDSAIMASVTASGAWLNQLDGAISVQDNAISSSAAGNQSLGTDGAAGNSILIGDQLSIAGAGTAAGDIGSSVAYDHGDTAIAAAADLVITNSQGNTGTVGTPLGISSSTGTAVIGAAVDALEGGAVSVAGNAVKSQSLGNSASSAIQSGENAAAFDASVALLNQQINWHTGVAASTSDSVISAQVGEVAGGITSGSAVDVSKNTSAAQAYGNDVGQSIALDANTLNASAGAVELTGGTTGDTDDGNASATGAVTIASLQSNYSGTVSAQNVNSTIALRADSDGSPGDEIGSSTLSAGTNTQEAVALGSNASNSISLDGNSVGGGAGIASVQIGDGASSVNALLSNALVGVVADTGVTESTLSVTDNVQRAIGYGTEAKNTLSVEANSAAISASGAGNGAAITYNTSDDPFHDATQPTVNSSFGILNDQSLQGSVNASAQGLSGLHVEHGLSSSDPIADGNATATNDGNALVAASYGNDARNMLSIDVGTVESAAPAAVAHVGNAQAVFGDAVIAARASGGATVPGVGAFDQVVLTNINHDVTNSSVSTSQNTVQAQGIANQASNNLDVSGNTVSIPAGASAPGGTQSLLNGTLTGNTSFGVTNAQSGNGNVSASLLDNADPAQANSSASVLTSIGRAGDTIDGSSINSDKNTLSASATSNSAINTLGLTANNVATTSGVTNFQVTDANLSSRIGIPGTLPGTATTPFNFTATANLDATFDSEGNAWVIDPTNSWYVLPMSLLSENQIEYLKNNGWSENGTDLRRAYTGPVAADVATYATLQTSPVTGSTEEPTSGTPNIGGVTIVADGASIIDSTLSVDGNKVTGTVTGNSAANALSVGDGSGTIDKSITWNGSYAAGGGTQADHAILNVQAVGDGALDSNVAGSFGIATAEDADISNTALSVSDNSQRSVAVANTATSALSLAGNTVSAGSALDSVQSSNASVAASSNLEVFAPAAVSSSSVDISGNSNTSLGVINDATNTSTVSATNIATLGAVLAGEVGNAVGTLNINGTRADGDHVLHNVQTATISVTSDAVTSLSNVDSIPDTTGLVASTFTMNGNSTYAEASANRAANMMTLNGSASQRASGGVVNTQDNSATATASATTNAGLTLAGGNGTTGLALDSSTVVLGGNSTTALAQGNSATNVLNSVAGANYATSTGAAGVSFDAGFPSTVAATAAVLNVQANSGDVSASSTGATYRVALNATSGNGVAGVANSTVSVIGNSVGVQAYGNNAVNKIAMVGLNTGTSTAALGNLQTNSGAITAAVTGAHVGIASNGSAGNSSFSVGGNTISANAVGNSVSNTIGRK